MDPFVEASLDWSALVIDDLPQLAELCAAIEYFDDPVEGQGLEDLVEAFTAPGAQASANAVVGRDKGGTIVAYGWNLVRGSDHRTPKIWLTGGVHPAWRHQHIGTRLLAWQLERAQEWIDELVAKPELEVLGPLWVGCHVDTRQPSALELMTSSGLVPERWYTDLHRVFYEPDGTPIPLPPVPDLGGLQVVPYHPALSEKVREAHNEAFASRRGTHSVSAESWAQSLARPAARPEWSWVAMDGNEVVGYALNSAYEQDWDSQGHSEGWTDRLGVRPLWRRHHLGEALLIASMRSFADAGLMGAGLGVDVEDPERSLQLYERLGYEAEEMVVLCSTTISPSVLPG